MKHNGVLGLMVMLAAGFICGPAAAQISVTPTLKPTPAGQLIVVNNGPADQSDTHVSGNLVVYSNSDSTTSTIHYFDLATLTDKTVPGNSALELDYLSDVRGTTIVFTRVDVAGSHIFTFDTSIPGAVPVEIASIANSNRQSAQIGDQTIAWQDHGFSSGASADIVAYDRPSRTTTRLANDSLVNQWPGISPDGTVIVWAKCAYPGAPCAIWKATLSNGTWTTQQLVSPAGGAQSRPDTDGTIIAYSSDMGSGDQLLWQSVSGGTEQLLNLQGGNGSTPSISGGLIAFAYLPAGAKAHEIALYDVANNVLYNLTGDTGAQPGADKELSDISVTPDGQVRIVWQVPQNDLNVYAYTFSLAPPKFTLTDLGPMQISSAPSGATALNNSGQVTGFYFDSTFGANRAFLWNNGTSSDLGTLGGAAGFGYGINAAGQVVGTADLSTTGGNTERAFIWQNPPMKNLGDPNATSGIYSAAFAINSAGDVAGYENNTAGYALPMLWKGGTHSGAIVLPGLPCPNAFCQGKALAINDLGQAAGWAGIPGGTYHPVMWDSSGQPTDIGTLGGTSYYNQANGINNRGVVVGMSQHDLSTVHAFVWRGGAPQDLGTIPGPDPLYLGNVVDNNSSAWGINTKGDIVGISAATQNAVVLGGGGRAFLNTGGVTYDLSSLLVPGINWKLEAAWAINDNGQIVGVGRNPAQADHGYLLTPTTAPTTTTLASSMNPSALGQQVSITATVSPSSSSSNTPGGNVTFYEGSNALQTVELASGMAVFNTSAFGVGSHTITATYSGDSNFNSSISGALNQIVNPGATTTTVTASPNPANPGQPVTLTAIVTAVAPASGTPTGTVNFFLNGSTLGSGTLSGGQATFTTSSLTSGSITATYAGDSANANFLTSTSPVFSLAVKLATTTALTTSPNPSNTGQSVLLTATVTFSGSSTNTPSGTVTFLDGTTTGTTTLGTGTLSSGTATYSASSLSAGTHSLTASYGGDTNFASSTSSAVSQTVNLLITVNETIKVADAPAVLPSVMIPVTETISVADVPAAVPSVMIPVTETISVTDTPAELPAVMIPVNETIFVTDVPAVSNTPAGSNVVVTPPDTTTGTTPAGVTFNSIIQAGGTSLTTGSTGAPPPPGFQSGTPLVYYDISTSAAYTGPINICMNFTGVVFPGSAPPHFFHLENGVWVDHTLSVDMINMIICGSVPSLSPMAIFQAAMITTATSITAPTITYGTPASVTVSVGSTGGTVSGNVTLSLDGGPASTMALTNGSTLFNVGVLNAGPHTLSASFPATGSFLASSSVGSFTVAQAPLMVTPNPVTRFYGAANPTAFAVTPSGLVNGDTSSVLTGLLTCATASPSSPVGSYPIMCSGLSSPNYSISFVNGTLTVVPETTSLTVTVSPSSIVVGQSATVTVTLTAPDMVIPIDPSVLTTITLSSPKFVSDMLSSTGPCTPPATPGVATCFTVTAVEPNGRTLVASFPGTSNLVASSNTGDLMVTAPLESKVSCLKSDFRNVAVPGGSYLWFNSIFKIRDVNKQKVNITFFQSNVQFQYTDASNNLVTVNQALPDAKITFDPSALTATTTFDAANNLWITTVPFDLDDATFLTGIPWLVPAGGLPADIEPVTWCGMFASDTAGVEMGWRWSAAAYSTFSGDYNTLAVKPMNTDHDNPPANRDNAGTPEGFKPSLIPGARGKGGKNYTGSYSGSAEIE